jgi:hypothetical protein
METPVLSNYKDRRAGLIVFGVFEIILGCLCALAIPLMLFGRAFAAQRGAPAMPWATFIPLLLIYGVMATTAITLGIGSTLARRWARTIWLCLSAIGLCAGLFGSVMVIGILPHLDEFAPAGGPTPPPGALTAIKIILVSVMLVFYVLIPGALFLFYRSPHVKHTCEVRDPVARWTDRCPPPVLAASLLMAFCAIICLNYLPTLHVIPLFGHVFEGTAGSALMAGMIGLALYLARGLYLLRIRAWWIALGAQVFLALSGVVTAWRLDFTELYDKMGLDPQAAAKAAHVLNVPMVRWLVPLAVLPWLIWLLWIRRYFQAPLPPDLVASGSVPPVGSLN